MNKNNTETCYLCKQDKNMQEIFIVIPKESTNDGNQHAICFECHKENFKGKVEFI